MSDQPAGPTAAPADPDDLEFHVRALLDPIGDPAHVRARERAAAWLLEHPDAAHPRLLGMVRDGSNPPAVIELLPRFGLPESVPSLAAAMATGSDRISRLAGEALGRHPDDASGAALLEGVTADRPETVAAAAEGLRIRGLRADAATCRGLHTARRHPSPIARYHALAASVDLGCLSEDELASIAVTDPDADVRALAARISEDGR
jgi:hypothetical protein